METTTNYKLPQWVKADQIKMDDFNDAFGKIDAQMKKNADTANAAASAESVSTQITAVQEQIVAVEQEIKLVALGDVRTTTAANGSIVYDLSALNMADYRAFLVFAQAAQQAFAPDGITLFQANGAAGGQTVFHFHMHVLPRHEGDGVELAWPRKEPAVQFLQGYADKLRAALSTLV